MSDQEPACRILTISSSLSVSLDLVKRVQTLSSTVSAAELIIQEETETEARVLWTISNKYYTADVHFLAKPVKGLAPFHYHGVPALIYVWGRGEAYKHHIQRLTKDLNGSEPEVCLAVRLPAPAYLSDEDKEDEQDEPSIIDEFLSSNGFEFIDASHSEHEEVEEHDIPSLPRVLDALSTIMWPSMQTSSKQTPRNPRGAAFLDWAQPSFDTLDGSDVDSTIISPPRQPSHRPKVHTEMDELARWLEDGEEDPWKTAELSLSPAEFDDGKEWGIASNKDVQVANGFDDDFSVFVTAPPPPPSTSAVGFDMHDDISFEQASFDVSFDSDRLGGSSHENAIMYHSLGSRSDLGETAQEDDGGGGSGLEDDDMPSSAEIRKSAQRIFGAQGVGLEKDDGDEDDFDLAPFDIGQVMSALQGMKAEIADMDDEAERRKAAARVALGLVYGLEKEEGS